VTIGLIGAFGAAPARAGLFLDFDGVLADITEQPDEARIRPAMPELLLALVHRLGRVTIISGRPVDYVAPMVPPEIDVVGLYGLEWRAGGERGSLPEAERWRETIRSLTDEAEATFGPAAVEPKGLSLTLHYRTDPALAEPIGAWSAEHAARTGLEQRAAKQSVELHPPVARDKGTALMDLADGLDPVAYVGDDLGDLPAFDGLDRLAERGVATVRVVVDSDETPEDLRARADVVVDGPVAVEDLLRELAQVLTAAS
jgi:trehalose 6-phosphate phosphatase